MRIDEPPAVGIRLVVENRDLARVPRVEAAVWGPGAVVPDHLLRVTVDTGGVVLAAHAPGNPDDWWGVAVALPARDEGGWYLHSHMVGVLAAHRARGVGRLLKEAQRTWAREHGYGRVRWTFDPLREENAHFNLTVLGARWVAYLPDYYPPLEDALSQGRPTDRALVEWSTAGGTVEGPVSGDRQIAIPPAGEWASASPGALRRETLRVRGAMTTALAQGWRVVGFIRRPAPAYCLRRERDGVDQGGDKTHA